MKKTITTIAFGLLCLSLSAQTKTATPSKTMVAKPVDKFYLAEIKQGGKDGEGMGTILLSNGIELFELGEIEGLFNEENSINEQYIGKKLKISYKIMGKNNDKIISKIEIIESGNDVKK